MQNIVVVAAFWIFKAQWTSNFDFILIIFYYYNFLSKMWSELKLKCLSIVIVEADQKQSWELNMKLSTHLFKNDDRVHFKAMKSRLVNKRHLYLQSNQP